MKVKLNGLGILSLFTLALLCIAIIVVTLWKNSSQRKDFFGYPRSVAMPFEEPRKINPGVLDSE